MPQLRRFIILLSHHKDWDRAEEEAAAAASPILELRAQHMLPCPMQRPTSSLLLFRGFT